VERCNACGLPVDPTGEDQSSLIPVQSEMITTLQALPGHRVVRVLGVVTELTATSGLTATAKGTSALSSAMQTLRHSAANMGANAVLGLTAGVFGAAGGVTGVLGGDAVGVLLMGSAAVVEPVQDPLR
jgi:uncharacterized protein YbjQ (UPF0145 family)